MPTKNNSKPIFHKTESSFYYNSKDFAMPRFATVYQLDLPETKYKFNPATGLLEFTGKLSKHKFTRQFDATYELFFENDNRLLGSGAPPLLNRDELFLYGYLKSLANRGLILRLKEFALFVGMKPHNFVNHLDRLEDALLIHRVTRQDLHGKPNDLIVHQTPTYEEWKNGRRDLVVRRLECEATRLSRKEVSITKTDDHGNTRRFFPRANGKFHFSYKDTIKKTFNNEADSEMFAKLILRYFYDAKAEIAKDVKKFDNELRNLVRQSFTNRNEVAEEKHYRAALTMRKIYAPVIGEF